MKNLTVLLLSLISAYAAADNTRGFYLGGGLGFTRFQDSSEFDHGTNGLRFRTIELFGGYKYNSPLGLELRVGGNYPKRDRTETVDGQTLEHEYKIDQYESLYYRPELANEEAKLYGLLGYSRLKRTQATTNLTDGSTFGEAETSETESGLSYGVGVGFVVNMDYNINFEYRRIIDKSDYKANVAAINFDYRF